MDWDDLRYFQAVATAATLQGAARKLSVNHSTVFRRINRFERDIGARLFERLADGYQLTAAGEEVWRHVATIGEQIDSIQTKLLGKDFRPSGKIRLTAPDNLAYEYLPRYLQTFFKAYPEIEIDLIIGAENLNLTRREADVAIRATSSPPPHLVGRKLFELEWAHFAAKSYLRRAHPSAPSDLSGHRLIGADGRIASLPALRAQDAEFGANIIMRCSTLNAMAAMAAAGLGIALLPDDQMRPGLVRLFPSNPRVVSEIWLLTHPELRRTERIRLLMEHLAQSFLGDSRLCRASSSSATAAKSKQLRKREAKI